MSARSPQDVTVTLLSQDQAVRSEVDPDGRERLDSEELWRPSPGKHREWLRGLCVALLESGGVKSEALLLTRPLCEVRRGGWRRGEERTEHRNTYQSGEHIDRGCRKGHRTYENVEPSRTLPLPHQ